MVNPMINPMINPLVNLMINYMFNPLVNPLVNPMVNPIATYPTVNILNYKSQTVSMFAILFATHVLPMS